MNWVTRARPHVDRCGTAWLIRRFIDPQATFLFVRAGQELPADATPFDLPGAEHGHHGEACTFETVIGRYRLGGDEPLGRVAALVHDLDFHQGEHPQSAGVDAVLRGLLLVEPDDLRVLERSALLFDALYALARAQGEAA